MESTPWWAEWQRFCARELAIPRSPGLDAVVHASFARIYAFMRESDARRPYHNITHVAELLALARELPIRDGRAIGLCAYFHDIVYDATSKTNEEDSAGELLAFAARVRHQLERENALALSNGWCADAPWLADVAQWIRETARHTTSAYVSPINHADFCLFLDLDMAILGSGPERYQRYARDVRTEYAHVSDADFARGRGTFLEHLLQIPVLYRTPEVRALRYEQALVNMRHELAGLVQASNSPSGGGSSSIALL